METFNEILFAGLKKYGAEIIAASLFSLSLWIFPSLRYKLIRFTSFIKNLVKKNPKKNDPKNLEQEFEFSTPVNVNSSKLQKKKNIPGIWNYIVLGFIPLIIGFLLNVLYNYLERDFYFWLLLIITVFALTMFSRHGAKVIAKKSLIEAENGNKNCQYIIGNDYYNRNNYRKAYMWFYIAGLFGDESSVKRCKEMESTSWLNHKPKISDSEAEQVKREAQRMYQKIQERNKLEFDTYNELAMQGNSVAQYNLGWLYEHGDNLEKDNFKAYVWYYLAKLCKDKDALKHLSKLEEELFPSQVEAAQAEAQKKFYEIKKYLSENKS